MAKILNFYKITSINDFTKYRNKSLQLTLYEVY